MKKIIAAVIILAFAMPVWVPASFAAPAQKSTFGPILNAGNKTCPVSGDRVSGKDFIVYEGVSYGLCCPKCKKPFLKDPEKYLAAMKTGKKAGGMAMLTPAQSTEKEKA